MNTFLRVTVITAFCSITLLVNAATSLVDPTRPADYVKAQPKSENSEQEQVSQENVSEPKIDYRLHAVKIGRYSSLAIINGETVTAGQKIGSAKVLKINKSSVDMSADGKRFTISLLPDSIKKLSSK